MKLNVLALEAARKAQSSQTGFIHIGDRIPIYENICFILTLLRTHIGDDMKEGLQLLEHLLHFEVEGNFPIYLHEYPKAQHHDQALRIFYALSLIYRDYSTVCEKGLRRRLQITLQTLSAFIDTLPLKVAAKIKYAVLKGENPPIETWDATSPADWADLFQAVQWMQDGQAEQKLLEKADSFWHATYQTYVGPLEFFKNDCGQPALTLFDLYMAQAQGHFSSRLQQPFIEACLVYPFESVFEFSGKNTPFMIQDEGKAFQLIWEHSIYYDGESDFYINHHEDVDILISGKKATVFRPDDVITLKTPQLEVSLTFEGQFVGSLLRGNRPYELKRRDRMCAYDWRLSVRSQAGFKVGLSTATPMACMPLST